jgi:hypothetical protein
MWHILLLRATGHFWLAPDAKRARRRAGEALGTVRHG